MAPKVSIVIATRNRMDYLREAVAAALSQPIAELQVIVVDDASDDGTPGWLRSHPDERLEPITLSVHSERAVALNAGLHKSRADNVLFIDDDDRLAGGALHVLLAALEEFPAAVAAIGGMGWFNDDGQTRTAPASGDPWLGTVWPQILAGGNVERGQLLIRRASALAAGGWAPDIIISDDTFMALRVGKLGPVVVVPERVMEKRIHRANTQDDDYQQLDRQMRERFLGSLSAGEKALGEESMRFFDGWMAAHVLYQRDQRYRAAFRSYLSVARTSPGLAKAPLIRPRFRPAMMKAAVGSVPGSGPVLTLARKANSTLRRVVGRYPTMGNFPNVQSHQDRNSP